MKMYKGFNKDMTCKGFQYEEGKTYELPEGQTPKLCESGFHACEDPLECFRYYAPTNSVYHEVDLGATGETGDDSKRVGSKIRIGAALDVAGICKAHYEFVKGKCANTENGGNWSALNGGDGSALNGGDGSALNGGNGSALNGGDGSALNGGNWSALNGGNWSALNGGYGSVIRGGIDSKFRGGIWSVFACEIRNDAGELIGMASAVVDGDSIKPDTWYMVTDGKFVETDDPETEQKD